jgi:two-component system, OmpR family, sensor histidine kinase BaeS
MSSKFWQKHIDRSSRPHPLWGRLWLQVTGMMMLTFALLALVAAWTYQVYWDRVLETAPSDVRIYVEKVFPTPGKWTVSPFRPGLRTVLISILVIGLVSAMIARWLLGPLQALEKSVHQIAGTRPLEPATPKERSKLFDLGRDLSRIATRLERAESSRRLANAAIAHELRNPLAALRSRVEALEYGVFPLEVGEVVKLHAGLDVLERLCNDLQILTLADTEGFKVQLQALEPVALLQTLLADLQARAEKAGIQLEFVRHPSVHQALEGDFEIQADPQRLRQILGNLLENALIHTPHGGKIQVSLEVTAQHIALEVADSGHGVLENELQHLFTPFWRSDPSRSRDSGGSGLGLAVVKALTEAQGGSVSAYRSSLGGLAVHIQLPRA